LVIWRKKICRGLAFRPGNLRISILADGNIRIERCKSGADGGGIFAFSPVSFLSTKALSTTTFIENHAFGSGGGLWIATSTILVAFNHRLFLIRNEAGINGGGVSIYDGAQIILKDEECIISVCTPALRGNGVCDLACMSRACSWYKSL